MSLSDIDAELILLSALEAPHGITVSTNDPELLKKKLYSVRAACRKDLNTTYDCLSFRTSPVDSAGELWIIKPGETTDAT